MHPAFPGRPVPTPRLAARAAAALVALAAALRAPAAQSEFVTVLGDALRAGDRPCAFACAAGIRLPEPDATAGTNALDEACAAARLLARELALDGFGMVRLPDLAVPRPGDPATEARLAVQDAFVAACKDEGVRVWAEVLHPVLDFAPSPADADALDDPASREAWREAVADTNFPAASILLAAPWDPRLEILVQRRLRDWARAFNPYTGLRRCDDPAYALFSFSSLWWEDLDADALPELPPFLARGLADAWNDWLYERYGTDLALRGRFPLDSGESLAEGTVAFPPPERDPASPRTRAQRAFLHRLSTDHLARLLSPFSAFGQAARTAPRLVRHGGPEPVLAELSTIGLAHDIGTGTRLRETPPEGLPLVVDATARPPDLPLHAAHLAAAAGADVFVVPAGADPAAWAPAAAAFRAGRADPAALEKAAERGAYDFPEAAYARLAVPGPGDPPSVALLPAAGAAVAVARVPEGEPPAFPPELAASGLPRQFLVCVPAAYPATERVRGAETARADRRATLDVALVAPPSRPGSWALRVVAARDPLPEEDPATRSFAVLARGSDLERKICERVGTGAPDALPEEGVFRVDGSPALLLFRPPAPGANLLWGL